MKFINKEAYGAPSGDRRFFFFRRFSRRRGAARVPAPATPRRAETDEVSDDSRGAGASPARGRRGVRPALGISTRRTRGGAAIRPRRRHRRSTRRGRDPPSTTAPPMHAADPDPRSREPKRAQVYPDRHLRLPVLQSRAEGLLPRAPEFKTRRGAGIHRQRHLLHHQAHDRGHVRAGLLHLARHVFPRGDALHHVRPPASVGISISARPRPCWLILAVFDGGRRPAFDAKTNKRDG